MKDVLVVIGGIVVALFAARLVFRLLGAIIGGLFSAIGALAVLGLVAFVTYKAWQALSGSHHKELHR